jgi:putative colanic acid biosynthesis acetyltransferase WcaF
MRETEGADGAERGARGRAGRSPHSLGVNARRVLWGVVEGTLFRLSFHNWYGWRRVLLRLLGATVGANARIRRSVHVEFPWNLSVGEDASIGDGVILYCLAPIRIGARTVVSQYAHLCAGTHDYTRRSFPLVAEAIGVGQDVWIAADVFVGPGVSIGDRTVVGARSSVFGSLPADMVCFGTPARPVRPRELRDE